MKSILFELGPFTIYSYGTVLALAFLLSVILIVQQCEKVGVSKQVIFDLGIWAIMGGLVGARFLYVISHWGEFMHRPMEILMIHRGGLAFYGGFLGGLGAAWVFLKRHRLPFLRVADLVIPVIPLAHGIGRIGCFLNGCCYGRPISCAWGINFPLGSLPERHFGRDHLIHPSQIYEMIALICLYFILLRLDKRKKFEGQTFAFYLLLYPMIRFILEFFRGDNPFVIPGILSIYQMASIFLFAMGLILFFILRRDYIRHGRSY